MKQTVLGVMLLCLVCAILPAQAAIVDSGTCGNNLTWTLTDDGALTVSGTGEMNNYIYNNSSPWASHVDNIKTVRIEQGVTSIGTSAFEDCKSLTSITIPESVTSIGNGAFSGCSGLKSITIPEGITSIGDYAFRDCSGLTQMSVLTTTPPTVGTGAFVNVSRDIPVYVPEESLTVHQRHFISIMMRRLLKWEFNQLWHMRVLSIESSFGNGLCMICKLIILVKCRQELHFSIS